MVAVAQQDEMSLVLSGGRLATGGIADVGLRGDRIAEVAAPGSGSPAAESLDLQGYLLVPAPAEPHAHLDKALTVVDAENVKGDLLSAIDVWRRYSPSMRHEDIVRRGTEAVLMSLAHGATAIRSHVDVGSDVDLRCLQALLEVKAAVGHQVDLQLVAFVDVPLTGAAGADNRALMRAAVDMGVDALGAFPYADPDPDGCHQVCLTVAAEFGLPVDLHTDETTDPAVLHLPYFADLVARTGFSHGASASHCVSLGMQPTDVAKRVAEQVAAAGVAVICLPQTNLGLQGRDHDAGRPRGLTALPELYAAGATVAGGGDNVQDPFNPIGCGDPLETAALLVSAGHLSTATAYSAVSSGARSAMGLPEVQVAAGFPAELLAIRANSLSAAVAGASVDRVVIHHGRVVSRTTITREFPVHREGARTC